MSKYSIEVVGHKIFYEIDDNGKALCNADGLPKIVVIDDIVVSGIKGIKSGLYLDEGVNADKLVELKF
jgi:hypothetical protein